MIGIACMGDFKFRERVHLILMKKGKPILLIWHCAAILRFFLFDFIKKLVSEPMSNRRHVAFNLNDGHPKSLFEIFLGNSKVRPFLSLKST